MIFAIDPGPDNTAYVVFDGDKPLSGEIVPSKDLIGSLIIANGTFEKSIKQVACEHLQCFGQAVGAEVFETAYWIGEYRGFCRSVSVPFHRVTRIQVKMTLCHTTKANDSNIRCAIIDRFGGPLKAIGKKKTPGPLYWVKKDLWSALAVAITYQERSAYRAY